MTPEERRRAFQDMDALIEHAGALCQSYELAQMDIMVTVARAKAIYKQVIAKRAELERAVGTEKRATQL
jgi:hypothetical protein